MKVATIDRVQESKKLESVPFIAGDFENSQREHLELVVDNLRLTGDWVEFGVWQGTTARILLEHLPEANRLHLFDSFDGLPENWKKGFPKGKFALPEGERPVFTDDRAKVVEGYFEETLPMWTQSNHDPLALIFIDCDLYSSTTTIFSNIYHLIAPGTVIVFDEYYVPALDQDEMTAFLEYAHGHKVAYDYLATAQNGSVSVVMS